MELYTLDNFYRREEVIDRFESLIWTERFSQFGDFQCTIQSTPENRKLLSEGTWLGLNESRRAMKVETTEDVRTADGQAFFKVKGRSMEMLLADRVAKDTMSDLVTEPVWVITDTPGDIARTIFDDICRTGTLDLADQIPLLQPGSIMLPDTIAEATEVITVEIKPATVYDAIKNICDPYNLGFRLLRNFDTGQLYFDVYAGRDHTSGQTTLPAVIFSPELDNLQNTTEFLTTAQYKNCAYVFSKAGFEKVYPLDVDPSVTGFERRILLVVDEQIDAADPDASDKMIQLGKDALSKNKQIAAFDGEISQSGGYKYGVDYELGDLVETRNSDGVTNNMQVIEQIFVSDSEGDRSYPTLAVNTFITPGSWLSWDFNQVWADVADTVHWADLP